MVLQYSLNLLSASYMLVNGTYLHKLEFGNKNHPVPPRQL